MFNFIKKQVRLTGAGLMWIAMAVFIVVLGTAVVALVAGMAWALYKIAAVFTVDVVGLGTFLVYGAVIIVVANLVGPFALRRMTGQQIAAVKTANLAERTANKQTRKVDKARNETAAEVRARRSEQQQAYEDWAMAGGGYAKTRAKAESLGKASAKRAAKFASARRLDAQVENAGL